MELIIRGYPSRIRFVDWQRANSSPEGELPKLSEKQKERTRLLRIPENSYAIALKARELARERLTVELERVATVIDTSARARGAEVTAMVWDFIEWQFKVVWRENGREWEHPIRNAVVDDLLLGKEGAEGRLRKEVDFVLGGWAE